MDKALVGGDHSRIYAFSADNEGNEDVMIDYFVRKFVGANTWYTFTSDPELVVNPDDVIYIGDPFNLTSTTNANNYTRYTVDLNSPYSNGGDPSWEIMQINNDGDGGTGGGTGSYDYTFTCPAGGEYTVPIPEDGCESENEYFARTFVCNDIANFYDACVEYYGCNGQADVSTCDQYL